MVLEMINNGFTQVRSTIDAIVCDLFKAFDCVHHEAFLSKVRQYNGRQNEARSVLDFYLDKRFLIKYVTGAKTIQFSEVYPKAL